MYYKQPEYFRNFKCMGGGCPNTCCTGWRIDWTEDEIDKVRNAPDCSEELRGLIESSFAARGDTDNTKKKLRVVLDKNGRCPFLAEDNFCKIQRELGEEYLSDTCKTYPRSYFKSGDAIFRCCNQSCPVVTKALFNDPKSMNIVNAPIKKGTHFVYIFESEKDIANNPQLKYRPELFDFFYEILSDKKHNVETSIVLGALAAQKLSQIADAGRADELPEVMKMLRPQLHNGANLRSVENITPNYNIKLGLVAEIFQKLTNLNTLNYMYDEEGKLKTGYYNYGEMRFKEAFAERDFAVRNAALNLYFELGMPFALKDRSIFENYSVFTAAFAVIKLNLIASAEWVDVNNALVSGERRAATLEMLDNEIIIRMAIIDRALSHNKENQKNLLEMLKENKMTSPAYLALLVK